MSTTNEPFNINLADLVLAQVQKVYDTNTDIKDIHELLVQFVKELDKAVCDWEFTRSLYKWAKSEMKIAKAAGLL